MDAESHNECRVRFLFFWPLQLYLKGYCNRITADLTMFPFFSAYSLLPHRCCTNTVGLAAAFQLRRTYHYNQQQTRHSPDFLCGQGVIADAVQVPPSSPLQQHRLSHPATDTLMSYWKAEEEEAGAGLIRIQADRSQPCAIQSAHPTQLQGHPECRIRFNQITHFYVKAYMVCILKQFFLSFTNFVKNFFIPCNPLLHLGCCGSSVQYKSLMNNY